MSYANALLVQFLASVLNFKYIVVCLVMLFLFLCLLFSFHIFVHIWIVRDHCMSQFNMLHNAGTLAAHFRNSGNK